MLNFGGSYYFNDCRLLLPVSAVGPTFARERRASSRVWAASAFTSIAHIYFFSLPGPTNQLLFLGSVKRHSIVMFYSVICKI